MKEEIHQLEKEIESILEDNTEIEKKNILLSQTIEQQKEDIIDCLEELTEGNTITSRVAEYFDYMRERYLGKWSTE